MEVVVGDRKFLVVGKVQRLNSVCKAVVYVSSKPPSFSTARRRMSGAQQEGVYVVCLDWTVW